MGNGSSKGKAKPKDKYNDLPDHMKITVVSTAAEVAEDTDPLLIQLEHCPLFERPILDSTDRKYVIDPGSIQQVLLQYQKMIILSSKAIGIEQHSLAQRIKQTEQITSKTLVSMNQQVQAMRLIESKLDEVNKLQESVKTAQKSVEKIIAKIDSLEKLLPAQLGSMR